jgi:hypothetical protein
MKSFIYTEEYLKSKEFNYLTFVSLIPSAKGRGQCLWRCRCGIVFPYRKNDVVLGAKKSCGCVAFPKGKNSHHWKGYEEISGARWGVILKNAKDRKIEVSITIEDAWKQFLKQNRKCALTGEDLQFDSRSRSGDCSASLDRIISAKGYTTDNIQWVHRKVNMMKNCYDQSEFVLLV